MEKVRKHPISRLFLEPVDPVRDEAPNYFKTIKKPMDLGTVQTKLNSHQYKNVQEWKDDMLLVSSNAIQYNGRKSLVGQAGVELQKVFKDLAKSLADGQILTWYNQLVEIKKEIYSHSMQKMQQFKGELELPQVNPKYQTKDIDPFSEVYRFLVGSMPNEELKELAICIRNTKDELKRREIKDVIDKYWGKDEPVNMELLSPAALIELKEICT